MELIVISWKTIIILKIKKIANQIKELWMIARASYTKATLWLGVLLPSFFINILMLALPLAMLQAYDRIIPNNSTQTLSILIIMVIAAAITEMVLRMLRSIICNWAFAREDYLLVSQFSENILYANISTQENSEKETILTYSDLINRTKQSHNEQVIITMLDAVFVVVFLWLIAYIGGMLVFIPLILLFILAWKMYTRSDQLIVQLKNQKEWERKRISSIVDTLSGIFTLKALAMEPSILRRAEHVEMKKAAAIYDMNLTNMEINSLVSLFSQLVFFMTVVAGALLVIYGSLTVGALAACTLLAGRGMQPVAKFVSLWAQKSEEETSQIYLDKINSLPKEVLNEKGTKRIIEGKINFENLYIGDNKKNNYVIENLSLEIEPRETICIQDDGSSAWLLLYAIMRFMQPEKGKILIDNTNVNDYELRNLRNQICYLAKEGVLYNGTILENISNFDPTKENLAREIAMQIGLESIISKLPQGFYTKVGTNTTKIFSNGFKQLVSFVRTMVNSPEILLINNITFNVDKHTVRLLMNAIHHYQKNSTIIIATTESALFPLAMRTYAIQDKKLEEFLYG
jgi:ATP-binding cassette subfamily C protein LapB